MSQSAIFAPFRINGVEFGNRILRSSVGGRMATYDGTVTDVWKNFEKRFADGGVAGIISTTFHVNKARLSPLQYPSIADDKYIPYLRKYIAGIKQEATDCRYIVQIGDPGYTTYMSLFAEEQDSRSASAGFDFAYGYDSRRTAMSQEEIEKAIGDFADAAARCQEARADGIEVTATKGYLIHQFLNPLVNRRTDEWGGDADRRFRFLARVVEAIRKRVGPVIFSASGCPARTSITARCRSRCCACRGRPFARTLGRQRPGPDARVRAAPDGARCRLPARRGRLRVPQSARRARPVPLRRDQDLLQRHPASQPEGGRTGIARQPRARFLLRPLLNTGWTYKQGVNLDGAEAFRKALPDMPVITNGGFQDKDYIEGALRSCDMVSIARALIANPDLVRIFASGRNRPENPCNHCNLCVGRTVSSPLGCYDLRRFPSVASMQEQILAWNQPDPA